MCTARLFSQGARPLCTQILPGHDHPPSTVLQKTRDTALPMVKTAYFCNLLFWYNNGVWRTDGRICETCIDVIEKQSNAQKLLHNIAVLKIDSMCVTFRRCCLQLQIRKVRRFAVHGWTLASRVHAYRHFIRILRLPSYHVHTPNVCVSFLRHGVVFRLITSPADSRRSYLLLLLFSFVFVFLLLSLYFWTPNVRARWTTVIYFI